MLHRRSTALIALLALPTALAAQEPAADDWISRSNALAQVLLEEYARFNPEEAGQVGVEGHDEDVIDLAPGRYERELAAAREALARVEAARDGEQDERVLQDIEILTTAMRQSIEGNELNHRTLLPYSAVVQTVFGGIQSLLDEQVPRERQAAALVRLRRYAGLEEGPPVLEQAADRIRERLSEPGLTGPYLPELERDLGNQATFMDGIAQLFEASGLEGWRPAHAALVDQAEAWRQFVEAEVRPRAREDFRLPAETYAFNLRQFGVDIEPEELARRARFSFMEIQNEMKALAPLVAEQHGIDSRDYREVIRALKQDQLVGEAILPHYQERLAAIEEIIRREGIVTLPERPARIRIATPAEAARLPAPNMQPPRLIGNQGEQGTFILPLRIPAAEGDAEAAAMQAFDDFTFEAASWTLTVHEARPGHELQFASIVERGVSLARALFAMNSVNVEGWALYTEAEMKPYLPLDGQLIALQHRLVRAARAFLDPELQLGQLEPDRAREFLRREVVLSEAAASSEVDRYTFLLPGQATSYFYGYIRWMQLRSEVQLTLGERFDRKRYHDFVLAQGLLPPDLLAEAVRAEFLTPPAAAQVAEEVAGIRNYRKVREDLAAAGQPSPEGLSELAEAGFRTVINLRRPDEEGVAGEREAVEALGLRYVSVPISAGDFSSEDVDAVAAALADPAAGPVLLHCGSSNRVGGVLAVLAARDGAALEAALESGREAGLRSGPMEDAARRLIEDEAAGR